MQSTDDAAPDNRAAYLRSVAAEIEAFVAAAGWDRGPMLFALVPTRVLAADPAAAAYLGDEAGADIATISPDSITPVVQDELPDGPLDEALASIGWPEEVVGCALSQEIVMLPPSAEAELAQLDGEAAVTSAVDHPDRREARIVVTVLRDGRTASVLRLRSADEAPDDVLTGDDLAPNLVQALAATLDG